MGTQTETIDDSEVFLDTSVLVDFVQEASDADCFELFQSRDCGKTTSPGVREEYTRKKDNRKYIVEKYQEQIGDSNPDFSDIEIPHRDRFSDSDERYAKELLEDLASNTPQEAMEELSTRRTLFEKGSKVLFDEEIGMLEVYYPDLDASLIGNLRGVVDNRDDREIIAGAVDWANERDKETLLSEDRRDFIQCETQINEAISITYGFDCQLSIYCSADFLLESRSNGDE